MSFQTTSAKVTGTPSASGWTQVHEFKPENIPAEAEKFAKRGHLFAVIATATPAGHELLLRLHEEYFGNLETTAFYALKNAVQKVIGEFAQKWGEVEIAATAILGDVVYSAAGGGGRVSIYRDGNVAKILESGKDETTSASGYPKLGDFIILGTKSFFGIVSQGVIKASLEGPDLASSVEALASIIHSNPDSGSCGCVIIKFEKEVAAEPAIEEKIKPRLSFKIGLFFKRLTTALVRMVPERKIYLRRKNLDEEVGTGRRTTLWVGAILLVLLFVSIGFGIKQNLNKKFRGSYAGTLTQAKDELYQAESVLASDQTRARELFLDSRSKVQDLLSRKISDKELTALDNELKEKESQIIGVYRGEPDLFLDLSLLSSGFKGDRVISSGDNLYVLDKAGKKVVGIAIPTKKTKLLAGPDQAEGISDIAAYDNDVYGIFADGIYLLGIKKEKLIAKDWQGGVLAYAYTGNIYVLDKTANIIWRYQGSGGGFGAKQNWIAPGIKPNFAGAKQIFIDGTVWILSDPFDISRFSLGSPQVFTPKGVFPDLAAAGAIYSNEEDKYLYILDSSQKRVVVLDKNGGYKAQYLSDQISQATGLVVSEKDKKLILLAGDKLYSIEIRHL